MCRLGEMSESTGRAIRCNSRRGSHATTRSMFRPTVRSYIWRDYQMTWNSRPQQLLTHYTVIIINSFHSNEQLFECDFDLNDTVGW